MEIEGYSDDEAKSDDEANGDEADEEYPEDKSV